MIVFCFFLTLALATFATPTERIESLNRSREEWLLDISGLFMQGILVPFLQISLLYRILLTLTPKLHGSLEMPGWIAFAANFVGVDYLYYWNHRLLHQPRFWPIHLVHHGAKRFDFIVTSRNTVWTPLFIVYLWINGIMIFILKDPKWYVLGASLTAGLDLWRHTHFGPPLEGAFFRSLNRVFIFPIDHAWHHSSSVYNVNFGANFKLWDRFHGTLWEKPEVSENPSVGAPYSLTPAQQLLWPFEHKKRGST